MKKMIRMLREDRNQSMSKKELRSLKHHGMNKHHLVNSCMGGLSTMQNLLWIYSERHEIWHKLFKNLNLDQVIELLIRVRRAKKNQQLNHER